MWIAPAVLRFLSFHHAGEALWEAGFARMLAYAAKAGWVDEQGAVRTHITPNDEEVVTVDEFRTAMRALPAGISVITTGTGEAASGIVVSTPDVVFLHEASADQRPGSCDEPARDGAPWPCGRSTGPGPRRSQ